MIWRAMRSPHPRRQERRLAVGHRKLWTTTEVKVTESTLHRKTTTSGCFSSVLGGSFDLESRVCLGEEDGLLVVWQGRTDRAQLVLEKGERRLQFFRSRHLRFQPGTKLCWSQHWWEMAPYPSILVDLSFSPLPSLGSQSQALASPHLSLILGIHRCASDPRSGGCTAPEKASR